MNRRFFLPPQLAVFTTRGYTQANHQSLPAVSRMLNRMAKRGTILRVAKGIWANTQHPHFTPLGCVPFLLGAEQGYVSFLTALHRVGALSQIPGTIQVATTGHTRRVSTPIGTFEFIKLKPQMMRRGVGWSETKLPYRIAGPEKALIDLFYISTRKGRRFSALPELDFHFDHRKIKSLVADIKPQQIAVAIKDRLATLSLQD